MLLFVDLGDVHSHAGLFDHLRPFDEFFFLALQEYTLEVGHLVVVHVLEDEYFVIQGLGR